MAGIIDTLSAAKQLELVYLGYFNRAADGGGMLFWQQEYTTALASGKSATVALNGIANSFTPQAETLAIYPFLSNSASLSASNPVAVAAVNGLIDDVYQNLFDRAPDAAGKAYWANQILTGSVSLGTAVLAIANGATGDDLTLLTNKVEVATNFTTVTSGAQIGLTAATTTASFLSEASAILDGVTKDAATVTAAATATDTYVTTGAATAGQSYTLTAGADTVAGTMNNDTFNALTVNAQGATAETFSAFDSIDGGAGVDTLNVYTTGTENEAFPASGTVKNVEIINVFNSAAAAALGDASKFSGATQLWQINAATGVTNLGASTTAGFRSVDANVSVAPAAGVAAAAIALDGYGEGRTISVNGSAATSTLASVTVSGTVKDTDSNGTVAATALAVSTGKDVETLTVSTSATTTLTVTENAASAGTKDVRTVDLSGSKGNVTFAGSVVGGTANSVATIKGGSGNDTLTITTATLVDNPATTANEAVSAVLEGGDGNDTLVVSTSGTGTSTISGGAGNDSVDLTTDAGTGKLSIDLGAGNDSFTISGAGAVAGTDVVDGGAGSDTLLLSAVGAANIGAFSNFEVFDTKGLNKTLDVDILATKNTVTEFVASGDTGGAAVLTNVGAGVGFRVTGDTTVANVTTLTQKTAGALTVTLDIDETGTTAATTASTDRDAAVTATNATSVKAVFDSAFVGAATGAGDNATNLKVTGTAATTLEVVSGGANASNDIDYTTATASGKSVLTNVTVSGDRALNLDLAITGGGTNEVATVNASAHTGGLTFALDDLKAAGTITLGSGDDVLTAQTGVAVDVATIIAAHRAVTGIEKGSAEDLTVASNFDVITLTGAIQAADNVAGTADASVNNGLITFKGAGPATLDQAVTFAQALIGAKQAGVFQYVGDSYIFAEGATNGAGDDVLIKLVGTTGLNGVDTVAANTLYVF